MVETTELIVARGVRVESAHRDGFVLEAPRGRLDAGGRLLMLEDGVRGQGRGVVMDSQRVDLRYDSSNRLVAVEASGEVEVTKSASTARAETPGFDGSWQATGDKVSVDWSKHRLEVRGDVRFTERGVVSVGGVVGIPLDGGEVVCEGCKADVAGEGR